MKYAVISLLGQQFIVKEGDVFSTNHANDNLDFKVLLTNNDGKISVGKPYLENVKIDLEILKNYQGDKIRVFKYKAKSRYRKTQGFRPQISDIKVNTINF